MAGRWDGGTVPALSSLAIRGGRTVTWPDGGTVGRSDDLAVGQSDSEPVGRPDGRPVGWSDVRTELYGIYLLVVLIRNMYHFQ